jgi:HK97 family phage portal protein
LIADLIARFGLALLKKSANIGFTPTQSEELRKFFAIHPQIARSIGYAEPSWTGKTITEHTALNSATVWRCVQVISQGESVLPLHVMQQDESGKRVADQHPLDWVLYRRPNSEMTSVRMRQTMMAHVLTWGNAFALKVRRGGTTQTIGLWPWTPDSVRMDRTREGDKVYIHNEGGHDKTYMAADVFHLPGLGFDGQFGYSVVGMARQSLGLASIQDEYSARFFAQGGRKPYYLQKKTRFQTDEQYEEFREKWEAAYAGTQGFHKAPILEGDIELKELGMPLEDAQLLASRQFSVPEICRWFGVQPHLAFDLVRSTNNNIEHQGLEFITQTLLYWLTLWEQEAEAQLLTDGEQGKYFIKHNLSAVLRGDFPSRMAGYATGLQNGFMNPDQVCDLEDWNPLPGGAGKAYHIQLNMQTLPGTGEPTAAEQAAVAKMQNGGSNNAQGN